MASHYPTQEKLAVDADNTLPSFDQDDTAEVLTPCST